MADKVLTATELVIGRLEFRWNAQGVALEDSAGTAKVTIMCPYQFCDVSDNILPITGNTHVETDQIGNFPAAVQTALIELRDYMKTQALAQEGM